jgi:hypothetical protein
MGISLSVKACAPAARLNRQIKTKVNRRTVFGITLPKTLNYAEKLKRKRKLVGRSTFRERQKVNYIYTCEWRKQKITARPGKMKCAG